MKGPSAPPQPLPSAFAVPLPASAEATPLLPTTTTTTTSFTTREDDEFRLGYLLFNILWLVFGGGAVVALLYLISALLLTATIVGVPCGAALFRLAVLSLSPFGNSIERHCESQHPPQPGAGCGSFCSCLANLLFLPVSLLLLLVHSLAGLAAACSVVGLPFAYAHLKLAQLACCPFGKRVREAGATTTTTVSTTTTDFL